MTLERRGLGSVHENHGFFLNVTHRNAYTKHFFLIPYTQDYTEEIDYLFFCCNKGYEESIVGKSYDLFCSKKDSKVSRSDFDHSNYGILSARKLF